MRPVAARDMNKPLLRAAENIRRELKAAFPGTAFSVKTKSFSMGNDISVTWTDGPTTAEVDAITDGYQYGQFDGSDDSYNHTRDYDWLKGGAKYVMTQRDISDATWAKFFAKEGLTFNNKGLYGMGATDAQGNEVPHETVERLKREGWATSFFTGKPQGAPTLIRDPYTGYNESLNTRGKNKPAPKPQTKETTVNVPETNMKSVPSALINIVNPKEATARRGTMNTRAADDKGRKEYDKQTSYEIDNLRRIAKEFAKFCKDKEIKNPGRHDFRIWMNQNYPRITPLIALKQMAMDEVWGINEQVRSPNNGGAETPVGEFQKRVAGDKDEKPEKPLTAAKVVATEDGPDMDAAMIKKGYQYKYFIEGDDRAYYAKSSADVGPMLREMGKDAKMKGKPVKLTAAKIDRLWIVTYPGPKSTLTDILFSANVADLQKQFAGGLSPKDVFGMYDNQKEAKGHAESLLSALPGKIEGMMRAKAQEEPEKPHTPHFKLVALDETEYWSDSVFKDFPEIKAIYGIYIFDETLGVHMAELTPSHELWFVDHYITYTDDFMDKFRDSDENVSEEAKERMIEIEDYIRDNADYSERVTYKHASAIRGMGAEYIQDIGEGVSTEEDDYESQMEDAIEHENGNPHGWDALDKKPASDPRVRTDKDMQRENRPATEDEPQTTIHNFARRVRATRIKGNRKAKADGEQGREAETMHIAAEGDDKAIINEMLAALKSAELSTTQIALASGIGKKSKDEKIAWFESQLKQLGKELRDAITKVSGKTTAMRTRADSDDEGGDLRTELTDEDGMAIIDKIQNTPDMQDHDFHEFVEGMGIKPSAAETFAYGLLYDLLNEGTQPEPKPQMDMVAAGKKKK